MKTNKTLYFVIGLVAGAILLAAYLVLSYSAKITHHHANYGVYLNGELLDLSDDRYMEDVAGCKPAYVTEILPKERAHMHNNEDHVIHVHDKGVTWGHFFANIGFTLSADVFITDDGSVYTSDSSRVLKYILNGKPTRDVSNQLITSEDTLLISYGAESVEEIIKAQYETITKDAHKHNEHPDPGSCSGAYELGLWDKVKRVFL